MLSSNEIREIYRQTRIIRRPTYGIVSGYHQLPYVCLGESFASGRETTQVRGTIHVSPRFILRPEHLSPDYGAIFGEDNVDVQLAGRVFGFLGFRDKPVECTSEHIEVHHLEYSIEHALVQVQDEMERMEDITTGLILTPNSRYFPISVERFIATILDDEFSV